MSLLAVIVCGGSPAVASPPNIVLIIGDDVGWMDYGFMGSETVKTPNLDRLASEGTVFTHAFSTDSVCRPSLRTLLTGHYPETIERRLRRRARKKGPLVPFRETAPTLPTKLAEQGYASFQGGKHWEGKFASAGFTHGMTKTLRPPSSESGALDLSWSSGSEGLSLGRETMEPLWRFLATHRDQPFFVWYAPKLPHLPFDAPKEFTELYAGEKVRGTASEFSRAYWANMSRFDATVGELMTRLAELGLREETLVLYVADNGWDAEGPESVTGGEKGKASIYEIGFRTPLIVSWPGRVAAGARQDDLVSLVDVFPTILDFAGIEAAPRTPGRTLHPLLSGTGEFHRSSVFGGAGLRQQRSSFLRTDTWRYVRRADETESLYLIERDPREQNDLAAEHPELLQALRAELAYQRRP